ncbi:MAG: ABC transporter ATP-binding protein [Paenibacillaceae bacterium]|nr:ABC transporter ATP-binding protein [Paenibacillaceae bacterium]
MSKKTKAAKRPSPMTKLRPYLMRKKAPLFGSMLMSTLAVAFGLVPYVVVYMLCVRIFERSGDTADFLTLAGIALAAIVLKGIFYLFAGNLSHQAAYDILYDIRLDLADKLTKLPLGYFDRNDIGSVKHTMNEDVEQLEEGIAHLIPDLTTGVAVPLLTFAVMLTMDWRMALASFAFIPILAAAFAFANSRIKPLMPKFGEVSALISSALLRYVYGMKVIRAFSRTESAYADYSRTMTQAGEMGEAIEARSVAGKSLAAGLAQMPLLLVVPVGVWLYGAGQLTLPLLVLFIMLTVGIGNTLMKAFRSSGQVSFRIAGATRKIMNMLEQPELGEPAQPQEPHGADITFDEVCFAYDDKRDVLKAISFTVREGTLTALVGPSGAGKTTIARLVPRFWDVTGGAVTIGGADVRQIGSSRLLDMVSFVFQDDYLFEGTVMDNIRMGRPGAADEEVVAAAKQARCHDFIAGLPQGYETRVGEGGGKLSGGQRQRISIVRAFLKQAPILVLDEATALIDPENEARIREAIDELIHPANGRPKTVLMIAHRLHTIVRADQIVVVEDGTIAASGTHEELLASYEGYRTMWDSYTGETSVPAALRDAVPAGGEPHPLRIAAPADGRPVGEAAAGAPQEAASARQIEEPDLYRQLNELPLVRKSFVVAEGKDRKRLIKGYWLTLLESPFVSLAPVLVALVMYRLFQGRDGNAWQSVGWMAAAFLVQGLAYYRANREMFPFYSRLMTNVRVYLGKRLKSLPFGFFSKRDAATIETRIKQDAMMTGYLPTIVVGLIKGCVAPAVTLAALLWIDWPLALAAAAGIPLCVLVTMLADRKFRAVMGRLQEARKQANGRMVDFIRGIAVVRAFGLARSSLLGYKDTMNEYRRSSIAINNALSPFSALNLIMFELGFAAVILVGGWRYVDGSIDGIGLICFMMLAAALYEPLPIADYMAIRRMMHATIVNLNEIVQEDDMNEPLPGNETLPQGSDVELDRVVFGYDDSRPVLRQFSLRIPARGVTALVGPSGGGKTTALNLIARFWDVGEGSVRIGGADVRRMRQDTLMRQVTFVFQDVYLMADTILNNVKYGRPEATMEEVAAAAKAARCHDFIMELPDGYETVVSEGGGTLSGGQKQRISIARAMLKDAPIVLLDEATASVDPENELYIREALEALAANKTVVMVAHRLHTIRNAAQIAVVENGQVAEIGRHEELLERGGLYRTFWQERVRAEQWQIGGGAGGERAVK